MDHTVLCRLYEWNAHFVVVFMCCDIVKWMKKTKTGEKSSETKNYTARILHAQTHTHIYGFQTVKYVNVRECRRQIDVLRTKTLDTWACKACNIVLHQPRHERQYMCRELWHLSPVARQKKKNNEIVSGALEDLCTQCLCMIFGLWSQRLNANQIDFASSN